MELEPKFGDIARDVTLILIAAFVVAVPVYLWGVPYGNDMTQHYQFALQFESSLANGGYYPNWAPDANGGLGDVGIRFYPPLPYYALVFFKTVAGDWYVGSVLTFAFWFFIGGIGVYFVSREWFDGRSSALAAIVFTWLPYHLNQIYNAFFYAEFAGLSILPFCFLFVTRVVRQKSITAILGLSASLAILVLTHLPTAVMGLIVLGIYAIAELWQDRSIRSLVSISSSALLGAAASAFYWIKVVTELNFVKHSTDEFTRTSFDFHSNFLAAYFYVGSDDYISRSLWFADLIFLFTIGLIVCALTVHRLGREQGAENLLPIVSVMAAGVFLATPLSWPVWQYFPVLQKIQFPFRFLGVISICASILIAASLRPFIRIAATKYRPFALVSIGVLLASVVFSFSQVIRPAMFRAQPEFEAMLAGRAAAKSCECWWPVWAKPSAIDSQNDSVAQAAGSIPVDVNGSNRSATAYSTPDGGLTINTFYYPHWQLSAKGSNVDIYADAQGLIHVPGRSQTEWLTLAFREPSIVQAAQLLSIAVWLCIPILAIGLHTLRRRGSGVPK